MRSRLIILKIFFTVYIQTVSFLEPPSSVSTECFCSGSVSPDERKINVFGFFFSFFPPKMFFIVQLDGLTLQKQLPSGDFMLQCISYSFATTCSYHIPVRYIEVCISQVSF